MKRVFLVLVVAVSLTPAATFTVSNTKDSGPGSLRQAIFDSNAAGGSNIIEFDIPGVAPYVIKPAGQFLPPLKGPVTVRMKPVTPAESSAPPASGGGRAGRGAAVPATPIAPPAPQVVLDGSNLVKPRTPSDCPGATAVYNSQSGQWETSNVRGTGPNVRGYYGAGLAIHDSHDVEISGVEIRDFCIGVAAVRSHDVYIHDVKIVDNQGAAGVIFTGDDGNSGRTDLSFNNRLANSLLLDNGDGFEFTRGTHDSLLEGTTISLTQPLPEDGNAVEFASSGDNNAVIGNTFSNYVDTSITIGGNHHTIRDNKIVNNKGSGMRASGTDLLILGNVFLDNAGSGMTVSGAGSRVLDNEVRGNGGQGIVVGSRGVTLSRNAIYNNGHLGIDVGATGGRGGRGGPPGGDAASGRGRGARGTPPSADPASAGARGARGAPASETASPPAPVALPSAPVLDGTSKWNADGLVIHGSLTAAPNQTYQIEIYGTRAADHYAGDEHGSGEGETYLGMAAAHTDAAGKATFELSVFAEPLGSGQTSGFFAATATEEDGSTSKFSRALHLTR